MKKLLTVAFVAFSGSAMAADLHPTCEEYFKYFETVSGELPAEVKKEFEESKKQFAALPKTDQEMICKQSLDILKEQFPSK